MAEAPGGGGPIPSPSGPPAPPAPAPTSDPVPPPQSSPPPASNPTPSPTSFSPPATAPQGAPPQAPPPADAPPPFPSPPPSSPVVPPGEGPAASPNLPPPANPPPANLPPAESPVASPSLPPPANPPPANSPQAPGILLPPTATPPPNTPLAPTDSPPPAAPPPPGSPPAPANAPSPQVTSPPTSPEAPVSSFPPLRGPPPPAFPPPSGSPPVPSDPAGSFPPPSSSPPAPPPDSNPSSPPFPPPTAPVPSPPPGAGGSGTQKSSSSNIGVIAGAAGGGAVAALILLGLLLWCCMRRKKPRRVAGARGGSTPLKGNAAGFDESYKNSPKGGGAPGDSPRGAGAGAAAAAANGTPRRALAPSMLAAAGGAGAGAGAGAAAGAFQRGGNPSPRGSNFSPRGGGGGGGAGSVASSDSYRGSSNPNTQSWFSYEELDAATGGFAEASLLGEGGFGRVFRGVLPDGRQIAVKTLTLGGGQGEREFRAEVEIISRVHHRHLVTLLGYCIAEDHRLLVYEYVPNGTLEYHLHNKARDAMAWSSRMTVAMGGAKGLAYLHEDCHPRIIHRDIKSSNILLDELYEAKVADFGLAKLQNDTLTHVTTRVMGTFGYLAPEYAMSGKLTEKSDVYSYGVVLLELITGRKPVDTSQPPGQESLVEWARPLLATDQLAALVDPRLGGNYKEDEMRQMVSAAALCVRHSSNRRPKMSQVVRMLEGVQDMAELHMTSNRPGVSQAYEIDAPFGGTQEFDSAEYSMDMRRQFMGSAMQAAPGGSHPGAQAEMQMEAGGTMDNATATPSASNADSSELPHASSSNDTSGDYTLYNDSGAAANAAGGNTTNNSSGASPAGARRGGATQPARWSGSQHSSNSGWGASSEPISADLGQQQAQGQGQSQGRGGGGGGIGYSGESHAGGQASGAYSGDRYSGSEGSRSAAWTGGSTVRVSDKLVQGR